LTGVSKVDLWLGRHHAEALWSNNPVERRFPPGTYDLGLSIAGPDEGGQRVSRLRFERDFDLAGPRSFNLDSRDDPSWQPLADEPLMLEGLDPFGPGQRGHNALETYLITARRTYVRLLTKFHDVPASTSAPALPASALRAGDLYRLSITSNVDQPHSGGSRRVVAYGEAVANAHLTLPAPLGSAHLKLVAPGRPSVTFASYPEANHYRLDYQVGESAPFLAFSPLDDIKGRWRVVVSAGWLKSRLSYTVPALGKLPGWKKEWSLTGDADLLRWSASAVTSNRGFAEAYADTPIAGAEHKTATLNGSTLDTTLP
jgi:hypothetical protein